LISSYILCMIPYFLLFLYTDTATSDIYTLSLHDALPIFQGFSQCRVERFNRRLVLVSIGKHGRFCRNKIDQEGHAVIDFIPTKSDRKSTRLNSSHLGISYAVFCLKKKKKNYKIQIGHNIS